ncbi:MAG: ABC transporter ATP-binding protein [Bacteroidia bacterium]|jgi:iron complex transport system ATP-binding protein
MVEGLVMQELLTGYPGAEVLHVHPINLQAMPGEIWMLGGKNGTGKSTLLRTMAGIAPPRGGQIFWNKTDTQTLDSASRSKIFSLVLTQKPDAALFTALEIVETGLFHRSMRPREKARLAFEYLDGLSASQLAGRRFEQLSDGEKQRVMMARALAQDTPVLLLDEPTAFLDFAARNELSGLLSRWAGELNKLIFVSSHDHHVLLPVCTHLLFLDKSGARVMQGADLQQKAYSFFDTP